MSKPKLPGVDEKALEALARQFPSHNVGVNPPPPTATTTPETKAPVIGDPVKTPSFAGDPAKAPGPALDLPKTSLVTGDTAKPAGLTGEPGKTSIATADPVKSSYAMSGPTRPAGATGDPFKPTGVAAEPAKAPGPASDLPKTPLVHGDQGKAAALTGDPGKAPIGATEPAKTPPPMMAGPTPPLMAGGPVKTPGAAPESARSPNVTGGPAMPPREPGGPPKPPSGVGEPPKSLDAVPPPSPPPAPATVVRSSGGGRVLAAVALLAALVALVVAGAAVAPPEAIQWMKDKVGSSQVVDLLTERRASIEARFAADAAAREGLDAQLKAAVTRLEAIEAVGGSSQAAAKRIDALEAAVNGLSARLAANDETAKALLASLTNMQGRVGEFENTVKATGAQIAALGEAQQRALGELAASVEAVKKVDRRPERLYLASMQLRSTTQTSGPFAKELTVISPLAGNGEEMRAALRVLASRAETGVPTVAELRATFARNVSPRLAASAPAARESAAERGTAWVRSLFSSSQARSAPGGNRNATAVALAERHLADGQLATAVDQLLLLEGSAALVASEWLREANARLAVDRATAAVAAQAFEQLRSAP
jgi:hypothetical protein